MRIFLAAMLLLNMAFGCFAEAKQALTLHMHSGGNIIYLLDSEPVIGFRGGLMVVTAESEETEIPMEDIDHWTIGYAEASETETVSQSAEVSLEIYGQSLTIHNPQGLSFVVSALNGQVVGSGTENAAKYTLPHGIYIIKVANKIYKIAIR